MSPPLNQTTPPAVASSFTAQHVFFNPSSTALFAIVFGSNNTHPAIPGTFFAWPVIDGKVSTTPVISVIPNLRQLFSGQFVNDDTMIVTETTFGTALLHVSPSLKITEKQTTVIPNQLAACWTSYSPRFDSVYVSDALTTNVTIIDPKNGAIKTQVPLDTSLGGAVDSAVERRWLYVLTGGPGIAANVAVIDLEGSNSGRAPVPVQNFRIGDSHLSADFIGMAVYPS